MFGVPHLQNFISKALDAIPFSTEQKTVLVLITSFARQDVT
jgi:hypothetical protein